MKKVIISIYTVFITSLIIIGCSELETDIPTSTNPSVHGEGVLDINSPNFHGNYFVNMKFSDCQQCHAKSFEGGITPVNCAASGCHPAIAIHKDSTGVYDKNSSNFHGRYLLKNSFADCQQCHGANFEGGLSSPSCATCHSSISVHKSGLIDPTSPNFHGKNQLTANFANCQSCHGSDFAGGISSPSCVKCHSAIGIHKVGIVDTASANFHGKVKLTNGFEDCQQCHGDNLNGGTLSPTCANCHSAISVHVSGVVDPASPNFHGKNQLSKNFENCQSCHGENFQGGVSSPSCVTCHSAISVHKTGILEPTSANFHGKNELTKSLANCQQCHGENFAGGNLSPSCVTCHAGVGVHKAGILNSSSPDFHGRSELTRGFTNCQQCHGENFAGGTLSPSCVTCHAGITVHKDGVLNPSSENFHGKFISNNGWDLQTCSQCHGTNYSGGSLSTSCLSCHSQPQGPEACNTCHGDFNDPTRIAPPRDLNGNTATTFVGVGAHTNHLYNNVLGKTVECSTCHNVPQNFNSGGHIDGNPKAEVNLQGLAKFNVANNANYNFPSATCANTYCHGNFEFQKSEASAMHQFVYAADKIEGSNKNVVWNKVDASEAVCGSCHGLPPAGHIDYGGLSTCANCHVGVVDAQGNIIDKTKHINGVKNVFGN